MSLIFVFVLLASPFVGSFIATAIDRSGDGRDWIFDRSTCEQCGKGLRIPDLIPVLGWLLRRGRCRNCDSRIPYLYPVVEIASLVAAAIAFLVLPPHLFLPTVLLSWLLIALSVIDVRERRLPDGLNACVFLLGVGVVLWCASGDILANLAASLASFAILFSVEKLYLRLRGRHGLGRGDTKLFVALSVWTGPAELPIFLLLASGAALAFTLVQGRFVADQGSIQLDTETPFGPFIALAGWLVWLFAVN